MDKNLETDLHYLWKCPEARRIFKWFTVATREKSDELIRDISEDAAKRLQKHAEDVFKERMK